MIQSMSITIACFHSTIKIKNSIMADDLYGTIHEIARNNIREKCRRDYNQSYDEVIANPELENKMNQSDIQNKVIQEYKRLVIESLNDLNWWDKVLFCFQIFKKNKTVFFLIALIHFIIYIVGQYGVPFLFTLIKSHLL